MNRLRAVLATIAGWFGRQRRRSSASAGVTTGLGATASRAELARRRLLDLRGRLDLCRGLLQAYLDGENDDLRGLPVGGWGSYTADLAQAFGPDSEEYHVVAAALRGLAALSRADPEGVFAGSGTPQLTPERAAPVLQMIDRAMAAIGGAMARR